MIRGIRQASTVICAWMFVVGCHSATSAGGSSVTGEQAGTAIYKSGLGSQLTTATITDPSLNNVVAATLTIPAGWKLQGLMMVSPCNSTPWPVFRSYSPDGLMQMRSEPVFGWRWRPQVHALDTSGCAPLSGTITAAQFLQYYVSTMQGGVHVVGTMPVPAAYQQWASGLAAQANQMNSRIAPALQSQNTADTAALRIEVMNGTVTVEGAAAEPVVACGVNNSATTMNGGTCWARVDVLTAPQGKLDALVQLVDSNNLPHGVFDPPGGEHLQRQQQQGNAMLARLAAQEKAESQMIYQQFQQIMARSQAEHQAFMQQQESQFQSAMNNAKASMNARTTAASDWVDYSLDQQTVMNPDGSTAKVSSAYSQTWTNGTQWYQTNNPNANPNGILAGSWTQTTQVHGNGEPK